MIQHYNELNDLIGKILRIDISDREIPLYGRLNEVSPFWIVVERKNGERRMISLGRIVGVETVGDQA